jgi:hypothetical protein
VKLPIPHRAVRALVFAASALAGAPLPAHAALGGSASSVISDAIQLSATRRALAPQSALFSVK